MKKFKLVIILFFTLFIQQLHSEPNYFERFFSIQNFGEDELSFEANDDYNYLMGILPSAQVFFNIVPEAPVAFSFNAKDKDSNSELITSKTKRIFNLSFHQISSFSRYCSAFIQIYLRTACFRL
ncbi:MAG TPA: hypothetical protein VLQ91_06495 [Draconibacterium sp.]|nr:hypothetical protein [Draconibacterium sp.]